MQLQKAQAGKKEEKNDTPSDHEPCVLLAKGHLAAQSTTLVDTPMPLANDDGLVNVAVPVGVYQDVVNRPSSWV
jgi:hypothetical protein